MPDLLLTLVSGVQALRRRVEQFRCPLAGGLGVAADVYPHQVATVHRILNDLRIRHLLADEVGLGKTVQALMILNALRLQNPQLKTLILVPDSLERQWWNELLSRGHIIGLDQDADKGSSGVRLLKVSSDEVMGALSPALYDFLIVDEFHTLPLEIQDRIANRAPEFASLLLLTATPDLRSGRNYDTLMQVLEPLRFELATFQNDFSDESQEGTGRQTPVRFLFELDQKAAELLQDNQQANWADILPVLPADNPDPVLIARCFATHRQIARTRRATFKLVRRKHRPIDIEPLAQEIERQRLIWRYIGRLGQLERQVQPGPLARKALRSAPALRDRVGELRRANLDPEGVLSDVEKLLSLDHGDSRLDALTDLLGEIWRTELQAQVVVVAEDNPTIDYLNKVLTARFPRIGQIGDQRLKLQVAQLRAQSAGGSLADPTNEFQRNLELFTSGDAQLLLVSEAGQRGLNLQGARHMVFYSLPWKPEELEQWIGRLDRIGNPALHSETDGKLRRLVVHTIMQRGQVDSRILRVVEAFNIFENPIPLESTWLAETTKLIERAALNPDEVNWQDLEAQAKLDAECNTGNELESPLSSYLPWDERRARTIFYSLRATSPLQPCSVLAPSKRLSDYEDAFKGWLVALKVHNEYEIQKRRDGYSTLKYASQRVGQGFRITSNVRLGDSIIDRNTYAAPFLYRRRQLKQPPLIHVSVPGKNNHLYERPLFFANHGSPLHEELVNGWLDYSYKEGLNYARYLQVALQADFEPMPRGRLEVILAVGWVDAGTHVLPPMDQKLILQSLPDDGRASYQKARSQIITEIKAAQSADERWIRSLLPAQLLTVAFIIRKGGTLAEWKASEKLAQSLLRLFLPQCGTATSRSIQIHPEEEYQLKQCEGEIIERFSLLAGKRWEGKYSDLQHAIEERDFLCAVEAHEVSVIYQHIRKDLDERVSGLAAEAAAVVRQGVQAQLHLHDQDALARQRLASERRRCIQQSVEKMKSPGVEMHNVVRLRLIPPVF